ncbi:hypothetical protein D3C85_700270 [compost metagenome]
MSASRKAISRGPPLASSLRFAVSPMQPKNSSNNVGLMLVSSATDTPPQVASRYASTANSKPPTMGSGMLYRASSPIRDVITRPITSTRQDARRD